MKTSISKADGLTAAGFRFGIIAARFNAEIVSSLTAGAKQALLEAGASESRIHVFQVPGSFEIPLACRYLIQTKKYDALVALGAVIRGETYHFELVANESARGVAQVMLESGVPIGLGIITTENLVQARVRADETGENKGRDAALAALEMIHFAKSCKE